MKHKNSLSLLSFMLLCSLSMAQVNITDSYFAPDQTYKWTKNNVYLLDGLCYVDSNSVLEIEAGTVVKFTSRADVGNPSALVIQRGAKIIANGTKTEPIIFTTEGDDPADPTDVTNPHAKNSLWGGIVILGKGKTVKNGNSVVTVEGIATTEPRGRYGMPIGQEDNSDSSGVLRYVSIRHGGRQLTSGNELNGLTLGAVGSRTKLEYIEVYANSDDGIEFFGGAPNLKYAAVAFAEDDSYDWDEAYVGKGQFWFSIQRSDIADLGYELDGTTPDDGTPYSNGTVFNATHIGAGNGASAANPLAILLRAGTAGTIANSIFTDTRGKGIEIQDKASPVNDAYEKLKNGELKVMSNLFWKTGTTTALDDIIRITSTADEKDAATLKSHLATNKNMVSDPMFYGVGRATDNQLYPVPSSSAMEVTSNLATIPTDPFFTAVDYKGAFAPDDTTNFWLKGWTALWKNGHLKKSVVLGLDNASELVSSFNIFPNPSNGLVNVAYTINSDKNLKLSIYNSIGEEVIVNSNALSAGNYSQTLDFSTLNSGTYFIRFSDGKKSFTKAVVKE